MQDEPRGLTLEPDRVSRHSAGIHASPAEVYQALTDPKTLSHWFVSEASIDLRPGGAYRWVFGDATGVSGPDASVASGRFETIRPQELLRLKARVRDLDTDLEFRLDPWRDGTLLTISHAGIPGEEEWDETFRAIDQGWESEIQILKFHLERARGMSRRSWVHDARLPAPAEEIFDRFTTQAGLCSWLADNAAADPSLGGELRLEWKTRPGVKGRFVVCDPDRLLVMSWEGETPSVVRVWFEETPDGLATDLSLEHRRFATDAAALTPFPWDESLGRLEAVVRAP